MVRLKVVTKKRRMGDEGDFNSTMVRLKELSALPAQLQLGYFNSTMVRLKALCCYSALAHPAFQFHYGTIKRYSHPNTR